MYRFSLYTTITYILIYILTHFKILCPAVNVQTNKTAEQILESREKKWILIGLLRSVPEKSSLNLTLYMGIALSHSVYLLITPRIKTPKKSFPYTF